MRDSQSQICTVSKQCVIRNLLLKDCICILHFIKDSAFDKLTGLNFKNGSMNSYSGLFNIQCRFLPVGVHWKICLSKGTAAAKSCDSTFRSIAAQSTIHFSLKCLTKAAGSYKRSYILYHLKVFTKNEVFKEVQWF